MGNGMAWLVRIFTAATFVVHLTVGCCSHHAHGCEGAFGPSSAQDHATYDGQCPENGSDHSHHGPQHCQGEKCSFISPSRTVSDSLSQPFQASVAVLLNDLPLPSGISSGQRFLPMSQHSLPVRLHLANQVLLI
jgi:hypothetical protein